MILTFSFKFWCDYLDMSAVRPFVLLSLNSLAGFFFCMVHNILCHVAMAKM